MSNFLKSLLIFAASLVFCLAIVEAGVRLLADDGMQYDLEMWKYARAMKRVSTIADAGHDHVPGTSARLMGVDVRINSTGQRNTEILRPKPDDVYRIVMLGDSLTFGWGVEEEQTSSRRLERKLNSVRSNGKRVSIVNAGVGNYNTKMQAAWLVAEGDRYEPDMIVLNYFINDAEPTPVRRGGALRGELIEERRPLLEYGRALARLAAQPLFELCHLLGVRTRRLVVVREARAPRRAQLRLELLRRALLGRITPRRIDAREAKPEQLLAARRRDRRLPAAA